MPAILSTAAVLALIVLVVAFIDTLSARHRVGLPPTSLTYRAYGA